MNQTQRITLAQLVPGMHAIVHEIRGGADFSGRVAAMGLTRGTLVEMLQNNGRGPVLVRVHQTHLALGRGEASKILVEPSSDEPAA